MTIYNSYMVNIEDMYNRFLKSKGVILCKGTALAFQGCSNASGIPVEYYYENEKPLPNTSYFKGYHMRGDLDVVSIRNIPCTTTEFSICDMIADSNSDEQVIIESLADYITSIDFSGAEKLYYFANKLGIVEQFNKYLEYAKEHNNY